MASTGWWGGGMGGPGGGLTPMHGRVADLGQTVASYPAYEQAQRAVDFLSDQGFPVQNAAIVGTNLSLVEKVLGRMTTGKAALGGAMSGAWFGLFIGLMFGIFSHRSWLAVVFTGLVIGALWGAIFGAIAHAATRGTRDFISRSALAAGSYDIKADPASAARAASLLASLPAVGAPIGTGAGPYAMPPGSVPPGSVPPEGMPPAGSLRPGAPGDWGLPGGAR